MFSYLIPICAKTFAFHEVVDGNEEAFFSSSPVYNPHSHTIGTLKNIKTNIRHEHRECNNTVN